MTIKSTNIYETFDWTNDHTHSENYIYYAKVDKNSVLGLEFYVMSDSLEKLDMIIDFGDGNIIQVKDLPKVSEISSTSETKACSFTYDSDVDYSVLKIKYDYSESLERDMTESDKFGKKYIVKIYGKDYFLVRNGPPSRTRFDSIISRICQKDLPIAKNVRNISSLCADSRKIFEFNPHYEYNFTPSNIANLFIRSYNL